MAIDCQAANCKTDGNTVPLVNLPQTLISWAAFSYRKDSATPSPSYILDSGATLHISNTRAHFVDSTPASGCITGISSNPLIVKGTDSIHFVHPVTSNALTVSEVCYVPDAIQNLISIKKASKSSSFTFYHEAVHYMSSTDNRVSKNVTACNPDLYEFDYAQLLLVLCSLLRVLLFMLRLVILLLLL